MQKSKNELQQLAFNALKENDFNGSVEISMGGGKSKLIIDILEHLYKQNPDISILYCCNSQSLRDIGFKDELTKWHKEHLLDNITLMCYQEAYKKILSQDVLIADEADMALSESYTRVFSNNFKHIMLFSGTYIGAKYELANQIMPFVFNATMLELERQGIVNKTNYYLVNYILYPKECEQYNSAFNTSSTNQFVIRKAINARKKYMNALDSSALIAKLLTKKLLKIPENKVLIFSSTVKQVSKITEHTYTGTDSYKIVEDFNEGIIRELGTSKKITRGNNLVGVNNIIIEGCSANTTDVIQSLGRGKRLSTSEYCNVYFIIPYTTKNFNHIAIKTYQYVIKTLIELGIKPSIYTHNTQLLTHGSN